MILYKGDIVLTRGGGGWLQPDKIKITRVTASYYEGISLFSNQRKCFIKTNSYYTLKLHKRGIYDKLKNL
jgi:hypothetical protein